MSYDKFFGDSSQPSKRHHLPAPDASMEPPDTPTRSLFVICDATTATSDATRATRTPSASTTFAGNMTENSVTFTYRRSSCSCAHCKCERMQVSTSLARLTRTPQLRGSAIPTQRSGKGRKRELDDVELVNQETQPKRKGGQR
ncbi:hypothetical protein B5807_07575 [Epicoccum nigrum]|uniref:Uncharacterized protein n=1 Tax=Epicoccum nigrum TaxID=105696 RepID=A0A1Y2LUS3_EPING|nr:hypothetical protein B5807_07575 [Epicoccum nigrum]